MCENTTGDSELSQSLLPTGLGASITRGGVITDGLT